MIDNFVRIEFEFHRFNGNPENMSKVAKTDDEVKEIQDTYYEELQPDGWNMQRYPVKECHCKREVYCNAFTNTCECGTEYNFAGQTLAPRSQWEEDY